MIGRHQRDCLTPVADDVGGEHRLVFDLESVEVLAGYVVVRQQGANAGGGASFGRVDGQDSGVGMRTSRRCAPQHSFDVKIGRICEVAAHLGRPVVPENALADPHAEPAALCTAARIFAYPVQRQMLPANASRICASVGCGIRSSRSCVATTRPGVQKPHCTAPASTNACWTVPPSRPSTVTTERPLACPAWTRHAQTSVPSRSTEHEPHSPCSHAFFDPYRPNLSRSM